MNQRLAIISRNLSKKLFQEINNFLYQKESSNVSVANAHFEEMFNYTVYNGKQNRVKCVYNTYKTLTNSDQNFEKIKESYVVGCCIEILHASFLVYDDIMDASRVRRKNPCWYLIGQEKGLGLIAVNDGCHLLAVVYKVLKTYFRLTPYYADLVDLFTDCIYHTVSGQCLDMLTASKNINWNDFTLSRYRAIVLSKSAYYSFVLPVFSGMILAGINDKSFFQVSEELLMEIGYIFQIQDDYWDCFGNTDVFGKDEDIQNAKCSWLIVQALHLANDMQRSILKFNYGKHDPECVKIVKNIYLDLKLPEFYLQYEKDSYTEINQMINDAEKGDGQKLPKEIFTYLMDFVYKRNK